MHVIQYVLVSAGDIDQAIRSADQVAGDAVWSDWYVVGGRWEGAVAETFPHLADALANPNVLPVREYPTEALSLLDSAAKRQNTAFLEARDAIAGNPVAVSDVPGHIFGLPVADSEATARNLTQRNADQAAEWNAMLSAPSLEVARRSAFLALHYAKRLIAAVDGEWGPDSAFYDSIAYSCNPDYLREAIANSPSADGAYNRAGLYLVAIDFHY